MIKKILLLFIINFITNYIHAQTDSIYYHDAQMESQWGSSTTNDLFGCFVRFTPTVYPATLRGIRGYFRNADANSTIKWKIYSDAGGSVQGGVNTIYISPAPFVNPAAGGIPNQQYSLFTDLTADSIVINSGDIYIGAVQTSGYFGMGIDNAPNNSVAADRQWQWMNVFNVDYWNTLASQASDGQFGITAFFDQFTSGINEAKNESLNIFVNSENNLLYVRQSSIDKNSSLKLFDISGRMIAEKNINDFETTIDMSILDRGIYMVVINSGKNFYRRKVEIF